MEPEGHEGAATPPRECGAMDYHKGVQDSLSVEELLVDKDSVEELLIDKDQAARFLKFLDPEADQFIFCALDDDKSRAKVNTNGGRPAPRFQTRCSTLGSALEWMEERQVAGWGITVTVQGMKGQRRLADEVDAVRAVFAELDIAEP